MNTNFELIATLLLIAVIVVMAMRRLKITSQGVLARQWRVYSASFFILMVGTTLHPPLMGPIWPACVRSTNMPLRRLSTP
jgi:hypothetical protein